jgi:glutamyl-tRNA synthetase
MESLRWLGLDWDEGPDKGGDFGPYRQTERRETYQRYARELVEKGIAYYCFCKEDQGSQTSKGEPRNQHKDICPSRELPIIIADGRIDSGETHVIRFKMPLSGSITVHDAIRGDITVENTTLDDYILMKSDGLPVYHLAVVVDDHLMEISHVFRTSEWLPTFPLHGHIYQAFGWEQPIWVHPSVFLKPDGKGKMSKRDYIGLENEGVSIFVSDLGTLGYLPEAVVNWAALIGWSYDDKTEFFTLEDLIKAFSIRKLNPAPAALNFGKLDHFNSLHIRNLPEEELAIRLKPFFEEAGYEVDNFEKLLKVASILQTRLTTLSEAPEKAGFFFKDEIFPTSEMLIGKNLTVPQSLELAKRTKELIKSLESFSEDVANQPLRNLALDLGVKAGHVFSFLRNAITAEKVTPPIFETMDIIGKDIVLNRIQDAINMLESLNKS